MGCKIVLFYLLLSFFTFRPLFAQDDKMNACFLTINSSNEKEVFKKYLSTGVNRDKFAFHEFAIPFDGRNWFQEACKKNISCDIVLISGHFGGSFFGSSQLDLPIGELEKRSCQNDCNGLLKSPKEVFLLGCNTLSEREEDSRSPEEYLGILMGDDRIGLEAALIVEQRYGVIGTSVSSTMKRVFPNVPHIYGFDSVGPSGATIENYLKSYHKNIPDYHEHLVKIELERGLALKGKFEKWNQNNTELASALRITHFAQTSGLLLPCPGTEGLSLDDPIYEITKNICRLRKDYENSYDRLEVIKELLLAEDYTNYLPVISDYIDSFEEQLGLFLEKNPQIGEKIKKLLNEAKTNFGKFTIARIAKIMKIITEKEFKEIEKSVLLSYLTPPVTTAAKDIICSSMDNFQLTRSELKDEVFKNFNGIAALQCLKVQDKDIHLEIFNSYKKTKDPMVKYFSLFALGILKATHPEIVGYLETLRKNSDNHATRASATYALGQMGFGNESLYQDIEAMLKSNNKINFEVGIMPEAELAMQMLEKVKLRDYNHLKYLLTLWSQSNYELTSDLERFYVLDALINLSTEEQINFLKEGSIKTKSGDILTAYDFFERKYHNTDEKLPIGQLPYFIDQLAKVEADDITLYFFLSRINLSTEEDEREFIRQIKTINFTNNQKIYLLSELPLRAKSEAILDYLLDATIDNPLNNEQYIVRYLKKMDVNNMKLTEGQRTVLNTKLSQGLKSKLKYELKNIGF